MGHCTTVIAKFTHSPAAPRLEDAHNIALNILCQSKPLFLSHIFMIIILLLFVTVGSLAQYPPHGHKYRARAGNMVSHGGGVHVKLHREVCPFLYILRLTQSSLTKHPYLFTFVPACPNSVRHFVKMVWFGLNEEKQAQFDLEFRSIYTVHNTMPDQRICGQSSQWLLPRR